MGKLFPLFCPQSFCELGFTFTEFAEQRSPSPLFSLSYTFRSPRLSVYLIQLHLHGFCLDMAET